MKFNRIARAVTLASMIAGAVAALACSKSDSGPTALIAPAGMPPCTGNNLLSRSPIATSALFQIIPLGNLNPAGGHVFPTDHIYFTTPNSGGSSVASDVVAPGNITIVQVMRQTNSGGGLPTRVDYGINFFPCADVQFYFAHIVTMTPALLARVGSFDAGCSPSYIINAFTYQQCRVAVSITLSVGDPIGTMGGPNVVGFDMGGYDRRIPALAYVDPSRSIPSDGVFNANQSICPIDYFGDAAASMRALLGGQGGQRTVAPLCGQIMQDVASSAQGRWFHGATTAEAEDLSLVHDNVNPTIGVFSVGNAVPSLGVGTFAFTPSPSGKLNADFSRISADGSVYCYESPGAWSNHIFIQLPNGNTINIAGVSGSTCGTAATWTMPSGATQFTR